MTSTTCTVTAHYRIVAQREAEGRCPGCGQTHTPAVLHTCTGDDRGLSPAQLTDQCPACQSLAARR